MPFVSVSPPEPPRAGRPHGGGQAKVLSADEIGRVEKCMAGTRTEIRDRALLFLRYAYSG